MPRHTDARSAAQVTPKVDSLDFRFTIKNLAQLTTTTSPQVYVSGLPWQVKLKRSGEHVKIELCCNYSNKNAMWSCAARAILKLVSFSNTKLYEKRLDAVAVFNSNLRWIKIKDELVKWYDLIDPRKHYIRNNAIAIDVTIQAEQLRDDSQSRLIEVEPTSSYSTFRCRLSKVRGVIAMDSPEFQFRNTKCRLTISKRFPLTQEELDKHENGFLGVWLVSDKEVDTSKCKIQVIFRLISHRANGKHLEKIADRIAQNQFNFNSRRLIPLRELYDGPNDYVDNNSITLEVDIKVENINDLSNNRTVTHNHATRASAVVMECILCYDNMIDQPISSTPCGHLFCRKCITASLVVRPLCPLCNARVSMVNLQDIFLPSISTV